MVRTKQQCEGLIQRVLQEAVDNGFSVVVASDEEGNNWNQIDPSITIMEDARDNVIALSVYKMVDYEDVFENVLE